ncbi:MAG TPA: sulfite exporter TauE/SafE family protein [Bacillales bacterium]|nr:sulfite exporter TauE/SafE family protein [Bacillales bacterium]
MDVTLLILLFFIGFAQRFVATLAGSGGLISFPAMLILGVPVHAAIAANKLSTTAGSFSGFLSLVKGKEIAFRNFYRIAPIALLGGSAGGLIASYLSDHTLKVLAVILLCFAFFIGFLKQRRPDQPFHNRLSKKMYAAIFGTSVYNGAFGPGQGTLLMQMLFYEGVPYLQSVGLKQISTFVSSAAAAVVFISSGYMLWHIAIPLTLGSMVGVHAALKVAHKLSKQHVKWFIRIITFFLIIQLIVQLY